MTVAETKTARPPGRHRGRGTRSAGPVVVARATLSVPLSPPVRDPGAGAPVEDRLLARRADLKVARRQRRRDALLGLGVLAGALGAAVFVVDVLH